MSTPPSSQPPNPHSAQPILSSGAALDKARFAMVMLHGRGADAESILELTTQFDAPDLVYLAPQAANNAWYPYPFMEPIESNEPWLSWALARVGEVVRLVGEAGIPPERTMLLGFSQGASLLLEYTARHALRYGGVAGLSGGLIGPDGTPRDYPGSLDSTPVFLGCSDIDPFIPKGRVLFTEQVLRDLGAQVTARLYPNMPHTVNRDEVMAVRELMRGLAEREA